MKYDYCPTQTPTVHFPSTDLALTNVCGKTSPRSERGLVVSGSAVDLYTLLSMTSAATKTSLKHCRKKKRKEKICMSLQTGGH